MTDLDIEALLAHATPEELAEIDRLLATFTGQQQIVLQPHQMPPEGMWRLWLLLAGRGAGKTQACAHFMDQHAMGPPCSNTVPGGHRMSIIAPTLGDAMDACVEGPSGLRSLRPELSVRGGMEGRTVTWPNGATARLFGTNSPESVERLRAGGNRCLAWLEELAAWRYLAQGLAHMRFGLRVGPHPRAIGSTTPKNRPEIKALQAEAEDPASGTRITTATTYDNPHLAENVRDELRRRYEGTRLGEQELLGMVLGDLGEVFKGSWFATIVPESPAPPTATDGWQRVRYWDMAATEAPETTDPVERMRLAEEGNDPDWTAGARVAWHQESRLLVIEDIARCRRSPHGTEAFVVQTTASDLRCPVRMEQEPGASGKTMIANYKRLLAGYPFDGMLPSGNKVVRAEAWAGLAEQGRVVLVQGAWNAAFVDECEEFTRDDTHAHDDQIDAVSGAFGYLMNRPRRGGLRYR